MAYRYSYDSYASTSDETYNSTSDTLGELTNGTDTISATDGSDTSDYTTSGGYDGDSGSVGSGAEWLFTALPQLADLKEVISAVENYYSSNDGSEGTDTSDNQGGTDITGSDNSYDESDTSGGTGTIDASGGTDSTDTSGGTDTADTSGGAGTNATSDVTGSTDTSDGTDTTDTSGADDGSDTGGYDDSGSEDDGGSEDNGGNEDSGGTDGSPDGSEDGSSGAFNPEVYAALLLPENNSGVNGAVAVSLDEESGKVTIAVEAHGLTPDEVHPQHIHGFADDTPSELPTIAQDTDVDGFVEDPEAETAVGPVILAATQSGEVTSAEDVPDFPSADANGDLSFVQTYNFDLNDPEEAAIFQELQDTVAGRAFEIHGLDLQEGHGAGTPNEVNGTGGYIPVLPVAGGILQPIDDHFDVSHDSLLMA